jgi:mannose-6-phosphate isomerase
MCVEGKAEIFISGNLEEIVQGQTLLIPAENVEVQITSEGAKLLEIFVV